MIKRLAVLLLMLLLVTNVATASPYKDLQGDLKKFNGKVGVYAKNLRTGKVFNYNENEVFPTASTSKLVVALAVYKYLYPTATTAKQKLYDTDINYMMTVSDNNSFYELLDELAYYRPEALDRVVKDMRLKKTQIHNQEAFQKYQYHSVTTPYEMAKVFENIYRHKYISKEKSEQLKQELANSIFHDEIPRYMLTPVMHKVGQLDDVLCDVGVVDDGRDQILISVYTKTQQPESYASDFIATTSAKLYNVLRRK